MDRFVIPTAAGDSEILVGSGLAAGPGLLPPRDDRSIAAVLTQPGAAPAARRIARGLPATGVGAPVRILPDREAAKTFAVVEDVVEWLNDQGLTRRDTVVGVGGGALTDVAGFIAAVYLRGVEAVLVPTTLLGAVDAAIGGKTGVNVGGKNLAGAFRHPSRVVVDLDVLAGLPERLLREGAAEAVKAGLIADPVLLDLFEEHGLAAPLDEVVPRSIAVKVSVVEEDFFEAGRRAVLNYGHTIGHAVETAAGIPHGHAVAIGMVAAGRASALVAGFEHEDRQRAAIERLGLPTSAPSVDRSEALRLIGLDKKRDRTGLRMVLLRDVGDSFVAPVDDATVDAALAAVGIEP